MKLANLRLANFTPAYSHFVLNGYTRPSLQLQAVFGLRREESIKIKPGWADGGNILRLTDSWTKGGKYREVPIATMQQRAVLDAAKALAGKGNLIPAQLRYRDQLNRFCAQCDKAGKVLDDWRLTKITDAYTAMSLRLQSAFGLRREESIKIDPAWADDGDRLKLKDTRTKGCQYREIAIRTPEQRGVINNAKCMAL